MAIILASFFGVSSLIRIANFAKDSLVMALLDLEKDLNKVSSESYGFISNIH